MALAEADRQNKSYVQRVNARDRLRATLAPSPPSADELKQCRVFLDVPNGRSADQILRHALASHRAVSTDSMHTATIFIGDNPWHLTQRLVQWAAVLSGSWVVTPNVFIKGSGACVKYHSALETRRRVWVSEAARAAHPKTWILLLEVMSVQPRHKWTLLASAADFATAKVAAERAKRSAEVIALCSEAESQGMRSQHAFPASEFLKFITNVNKFRTVGSV